MKLEYMDDYPKHVERLEEQRTLQIGKWRLEAKGKPAKAAATERRIADLPQVFKKRPFKLFQVESISGSTFIHDVILNKKFPDLAQDKYRKEIEIGEGFAALAKTRKNLYQSIGWGLAALFIMTMSVAIAGGALFFSPFLTPMAGIAIASGIMSIGLGATAVCITKSVRRYQLFSKQNADIKHARIKAQDLPVAPIFEPINVPSTDRLVSEELSARKVSGAEPSAPVVVAAPVAEAEAVSPVVVKEDAPAVESESRTFKP